MFNKYGSCKLLVITNEFSTISSYNYNEKYKELSQWVLRENITITQVNDIKDFEASKLGRSIEWE